MANVYELVIEQNTAPYPLPDSPDKLGYRVKFTVNSVTPNTEEVAIFCFKKIGPNRSVFSNVCSPYDLETYPLNTPDTNDVFFRLDNVDLVFPSDELRQETIVAIKDDVDLLSESLDRISALDMSETISVPDDETELKGVVSGDDVTAQVSVTFPVTLTNSSPFIYLRTVPATMVRIDTADENGFTVQANRILTASDQIHWVVLDD